MKENYKNTIEEELKALEKDRVKYRGKGIYENSIISKKLLKINPIVNYKLDLGFFEVSEGVEEIESNSLYSDN